MNDDTNTARKVESPGAKHQTPNTKHQISSKHQTPNRNPGRSARTLELGAWRFFGVWSLVFGIWSLSFSTTTTVSAYPPAPHHTLFGTVRNQWGEPINVAGAIVYLQQSNTVALKASIVASTDPGVNYRLTIPMDAGTAPDLYLPTALRRSQAFQLRVQIGSVSYLPIEMALSPAILGQAGESTRLDLTLGQDTDGDGLPDAWEEAIIAVLGGTLASITADGDADGDGIRNIDEYLAGTYAFDPNDGFRLTMIGQSSGNATLEFLAIRGRTYALESSFNLQQWSPVKFRIVSEGPNASLRDSYAAGDVRLLRVEVPFQTGGQTNRYFKARVL